jgi:hypothetical protein
MRFLVLASFVLVTVAMDALSAPAPQTVFLPPPAVKNEAPKTVLVNFVNSSWHEVFRWLHEVTGKRVMSCTPNGTFTLVGEYTVPEVIAAINETFAKQPGQFTLIERERRFSLPPRDLIVGGGR